jgi:hypothetical protein
MQLRTDLELDLPDAQRRAKPGPDDGALLGSHPPDKQMSASTASAEPGLHTYAIREDRFYLVQDLERKPDNFLARTFEPEIIRIGKHAEFSCSVVTAVKRKNPLCLLNPMFLNLNW